MFTAIATHLPRSAATTLAAIALSATCLGAALAPARAERAPAAAPATLADWEAGVSRQIDRSDDFFARTHDTGVSRKAVVAVRLDAEGHVIDTRLAQPSGYWTFDRHALRTAAAIAYPPLPESYRGRPLTVKVNLLLASRSDMDRYQQLADQTVAEQHAANQALVPVRLAAK